MKGVDVAHGRHREQCAQDEDAMSTLTRDAYPHEDQAPEPPSSLFKLCSNEPIRAELCGLDALEAYARHLATVPTDRRARATGPSLLRRFHDNGRVLYRTHRRIVAAVQASEPLLPAAEWLLDNFYVLQEVLREVHRDLPRGYYSELPKLGAGPLSGYPRTYSLAVGLIAHTDSNLSEAQLVGFVQAFQSLAPLTTGELWAVPTMFRLALLENLRRLAAHFLRSWDERRAAEAWFRQQQERPGTAQGELAPFPLPAGELGDAYLVRLVQLLREHGRSGDAVERFEADLIRRGIAVHDLVRRENHRQATDQVSVANAITSLRLLAAVDWKSFFEETSLVEPLLRQDPGGAYMLQDFATRDRYRRAVEQLSRRASLSELEVVPQLLALARRHNASESPHNHIGYYLIDKGRRELEMQIGYHPSPREWLAHGALRYPRAAYFGTLAVLLVLVLTAVGGMAGLFTTGLGIGWWLAVLLAALLPASDLAIGLTNFLFSLFVPPRVLAKLDFRGGVPADCCTFIVVPAKLGHGQGAAGLLEKLEILYLANSDPRLYFALLTDFSDAAEETLSGEDALLQEALAGVARLNARHGAGGTPRFFLFHRRRVWNPVQGCWMGWERKRGKLTEFNRLLRGDRNTTYALLSSDPAALPRIRFVITLDADTQLPREAAERLIGTLAHPLNRARFDSDGRRVVAGYGVLQPRVSFHMPASRRSLFTRIWASSAGIDPYSTAVSDVYQDLFGAGTFTGKGIYDLDAFEKAVGHTFPDNHILSHDLIEGTYARCGLVTDIQLFDDFPARYHAYSRREHRWVRGDWQLLPWLGRTVPVGGDAAQPTRRERNPLPFLERWKIFDNLRRSLVPPALVVMLLLGWVILPGSPWLWTGVAAGVVALPLFIQILATIINTVRSASLGPLAEFRHSVLATLGQVVLASVFLFHQARLLLDAIMRTLWRLYVSRRWLLEWETAASTERRLEVCLRAFCALMWPAPIAALSISLALGALRPEALPAASPFLVGWLLSPLIAYVVSRPIQERAESPLTAAEVRELRQITRRTWWFFETFVNDESHWLPPDNFQEEPNATVAERTSPTNIGMLLLSTLAAHDLGYLSLRTLLDRLERTLTTLEQLERYRGHFGNWYDTRTLQPLPPVYISTVDSGNLLACLVALVQGLHEKARWTAAQDRTPAEPPRTPSPATPLPQGERGGKQGLADTVAVLAALAAPHRSPALRVGLDDLRHQLAERPADAAAWEGWLERFTQASKGLSDKIQTMSEATELLVWAKRLAAEAKEHLEELRHPASESAERCRRLAQRAAALAAGMDFKFLYKPDRHLFAIGYNLAVGRPDANAYDLLASESCLASFLAIARGDAPLQHWFHLGRLLTRAGNALALVSWGGTMFEYMMPPLLLHYYDGSLLKESAEAAVARQIEYGRQTGTPWGISESAFSSQYLSYDYRYQSFGVPGLGLKRGLEDDLVIAPYATALAAPLQPRAALHNFRRLAAEGVAGRYGFYESVDYTRNRLPEGKRCLVVRCFMAHHQGMTLVALTNTLLGDPMQRRFHAEPMVRATELLLQERLPALVRPLPTQDEGLPPHAAGTEGGTQVSRRLTTWQTPRPRTHLISNGDYATLLTNAGGGFSKCKGLAVTRWREDTTRDCWGQFFYLRNPASGVVWSATYQPVGHTPSEYEVIFSADKAEFRRVDGGIETRMEVTVSPEKCAEIRRLTLTNFNTRACEIELTSYAEVVLAPHETDLAHPAFQKLFLETEYVPSHLALLCRRRPRSPEEQAVWAVHLLAVQGAVVGGIEYETDRARFLGRGRSPADPMALTGGRLSGTTGAVLDPIFSLRQRVRLASGIPVTLTFTTAVAASREEALQLADRFRDPQAIARAFDLAWAQSRIELGHLKLDTSEVHLFQRLAGRLFYPNPDLRPPPAILAANRQGQQGLWRHGISGDRPIVVVRIAEAEELPLARQLLRAHAYWRLKGLQVDLVILCEEATTYREELHQELQNTIRASDEHNLVDRPGGIFLRKVEHLTPDDRTLLLTAARVVLQGNRGSLAAQLERVRPQPELPPPLAIRERRRPSSAPATPAASLPPDLLFANGYGGFTPDGREYCILPNAADRDGSVELHLPPAPWANVIANPLVGFLVTEAGAGCTWAGNSQTNRLTPWRNDPVTDPPGEVVYLRDEATGVVWTPTPLPLGHAAPTLVRHGQGYTSFAQTAHGLAQELTLFVPPEAPVKILRLAVRNLERGTRQLSATYYAEWVLGTTREQTGPYVVTEVDPESGALLARNAFNMDYAGQVGFVAANPQPQSVTGDRTEFLGRNRSVASSAALGRTHLSGHVGAGLDPCAAVQVKFDLQGGEEKEILFLLGAADSRAEAVRLAHLYLQTDAARTALQAVRQQWETILSAVQLRTPDPGMDLLLNRWLLYQVLSCRLWGRTAFYQSSGAYGYRDQLQDVMALVYGFPQETRTQILRAASRQFLEGDVQHWWHPPRGRGVRTCIADDFLWLPFVVCHYLRTTGDAALLDEKVPFLRGPLLRPDQEEDYGLPETTEETATVYEHCLRALHHGMRVGAHGLPLMGSGDWNDGMNRVGAGGKGESVWLAWFQLAILPQMEEIAARRGDPATVELCRSHAARLRQAVEENAWDGQWYRRAYFDDGTPLGSAQNDECQIDSLAQTWAVISGGADPHRTSQALASADQRLVRLADRLVLLLDPPFDHGNLHPGYIKGYLPGIRENGGQYTHAATWMVQATALAGQGTHALELFDLLNPLRHASTPEEVARYKVEPYVITGDVYGVAPHTGRGGWTWYTGSAAWFYRVALEDLLGFRLRGDHLEFDPCIARHWPRFEVRYQHRSALYHILVENPQHVEHGVAAVWLDGVAVEGRKIPLADDGREHQVRIVLGN
jgi:cyclic beta-1,2-glucan synthetase